MMVHLAICIMPFRTTRSKKKNQRAAIEGWMRKPNEVKGGKGFARELHPMLAKNEGNGENIERPVCAPRSPNGRNHNRRRVEETKRNKCDVDWSATFIYSFHTHLFPLYTYQMV